MEDAKFYVQSAKLNIVAHCSGADVACWLLVAVAVRQGRVFELGKTIGLSHQGFESKPEIEVSTAAVIAASLQDN